MMAYNKNWKKMKHLNVLFLIDFDHVIEVPNSCITKKEKDMNCIDIKVMNNKST